ncbi:MAG: hypothetical protein ABSE00_11410 [Chitinispirillaceae bacterium]|jgi:hypothetical protein
MHAIGAFIAVLVVASSYIGVLAVAVWFLHSHYVDSFKGEY